MQAFTTLLAVVVGGVITLFIAWVKERSDKQRRAEEWAFTTYIEGGIDSLYLTFSDWHFLAALPAMSSGDCLHRVSATNIPAQAIGRLLLITGSHDFTNWMKPLTILLLRAQNGHWDAKGSLANETANVCHAFVELRDALLVQAVRRKTDPSEWKRLDCVKRFNSRLVDRFQAMVADSEKKGFTKSIRPTNDDAGAPSSR